MENWIPSDGLIRTPSRVCIYCGDPANVTEHLIPFSFLSCKTTGSRDVGLRSDACQACNGRLSDKVFESLDLRVQFANDKIAGALAKVKTASTWSNRELAELSGSLRQFVRAQIVARQELERRVAWINTPEYVDVREFIHEQARLRYPTNHRLLSFLRPVWL